MPPFYVTTAIDYSNGEPHLGHAFEKLGADAIARYRRLRGDDVWFLVGMDEHGQKVAQAAAEEGVTPGEFTDRIAQHFRDLWTRLDLTCDQFIRTTAQAHHTGVAELLERIFARNPDDFYERAYEGMYCVGCEAFKTDAEVVEGRCALHPGRDLERVAEQNWFFRLSRYTDFLLELHQQHPRFLQPDSRRNEILALLREGLEDISASRARIAWGVPFPRPTSNGEQQTTYVWFDALPNYWTATLAPESQATWPAQLHVIGKDITRFHAIIWPAMLEAAGLPLPRTVWAHGFVSFRGEKLSKSAGQRLDLDEAVERYGADAFRWFLLREIPWDGDGDFSWERFDARYRADLADGLGNLASRTLAMVAKYRSGVVPVATPDDLDEAGAGSLVHYAAAMERLDLRGAAAVITDLVTAANLHVARTAPWALAKAGDDPALDQVLASLCRTLYRLAVLGSPFLPGRSELLWQALGQPGTVAKADWATLDAPPMAGCAVKKPDGLFPKPPSE